MSDITGAEDEVEDAGKDAGLIDFEDGGAPFDEEIYLRFNPDVRVAVAAGAFRSGRDHYQRYGKAEGRPYKKLDSQVRNTVVVSAGPEHHKDAPKQPPMALESVRISVSGGIFMQGWVNDAFDPLDSIDLYFAGWSTSFEGASVARMRRTDAETALGGEARHLYGFWGFLNAGQSLPAGQCSAVIRLKSGGETGFVLQAETVQDADLQAMVLGYLAGAAYYGAPAFAAAASINRMIGQQMVAFNKIVSKQAAEAPYVQRFAGGPRPYRASLIVCLYGKPEYMFLQNAMFARQAGIGDYEMIYVCNSPEIGEQLLQEAARCRLIYGIDLTVIILQTNAGFAAANNLASRYARSERLMFINPDVFPRDEDALLKHADLLARLPAAQTTLFSVPLYYDDGSLMHAGMYFELDTMPNPEPSQPAISLLRVEHYGKGAPPDATGFLAAREVPGVSGAFISVSKSWFETLGGFNDSYVFGHYEDADFCMKSIRQGKLPWLHDIRFWHLEGHGAARNRQHDGAAIINRWLFTRSWGDVVVTGMRGPSVALAGFRR